jgi:hypothetical protein
MALSLVFLGCGASFKSYRLPISAYSAPGTFPAIVKVASSQGLEVARFDTAVHVRLDEATWAYYTIEINEYNLVIQVDSDKVPEPEQAAHFEKAKQKADQIWAQALALLPY